MATWKKVIVSGSNVSQLNNDAGYLTAASTGKAFATASYDGTSLLADNTSGSLNFASSSGQGLTISANAGTDTLTFGLSAIPNSSLANSSVLIGGQTITLGAPATTTLTGMTSITSTSFTGSLQGTASYALSAPYSGLTGVPAGIVSGSSLGSANQGEVYLVTNGVQQSAVDLGLQTTDNPTFAGVTAGAITVGVTTDNTINTTSGNLTISSTGGVTTLTDADVIITNNLTVNGTATYVNTTDLYVEDKFILLASGSATDGDGGIVIDRGSFASGNIGFGYDSATNRWGFQDGIIDTTNVIDPTSANGVSGSFVGLVFTEAAHGATKPTTGEFAKQGAIYTSTSEDIWIYS